VISVQKLHVMGRESLFLLMKDMLQPLLQELLERTRP
jgi:hypothetical protein